MGNYLIGVDIGTGSTKAVAISETNEVLFTSQVSYPTLHPKPDYHEQAPEVLWQAFIKCIKKIVDQLNENPDGISLSSALHSFIPVDKDGQPLMNMITWADARSADISERIKKTRQGKEIYKRTGTPIHSMSPLTKIIWLKENEPDIFNKTSKFISIKEYIWFKIFGEYEVDHSIASATGLFDVEKLRWDEEALLLAGIKPTQLSFPVSTGYIKRGVGKEFREQTGISQTTAFIVGAGDGCLANLGSYAINPGIAAVTIGTSGAVRVASKKPSHNTETMPFNYRLDEEIFISGGPINNGGIALKWYAETFLQKKLSSAVEYEELLQNIETIKPGSEGLTFLPYLLGERAPLWNNEACGVFFGISMHHTQGHFTRAIVEGICFALYSVAKALENSAGNIQQIHVSGGVVHAHQWLQIMADIFNKKVYLIHKDDASAIGAAYIGMKALGLINDYADLTQKEKPVIFTPNTNHHMIYQDSFSRFERLYTTLKGEMAVLSQSKKE